MKTDIMMMILTITLAVLIGITFAQILEKKEINNRLEQAVAIEAMGTDYGRLELSTVEDRLDILWQANVDACVSFGDKAPTYCNPFLND